jgi:DNA repair protein RadC
MNQSAAQIIPFSYRMRDLPERMRPREQFDRIGAEGVSDAVLIALILRTGGQGHNVMRIAEDLLAHYRTLGNLARTPADQIMRAFKGKGLGKVKIQVLKAALELARRLAEESQNPLEIINGPDDAARVLYSQTRPLDHEVFYVLPLDSRNRLKSAPLVVSEGILNATLVHSREVFQSAIGKGASSIIVAHNHPSGDPTPSREDLKITNDLVQSGRVLGIKLIDHVVVGHKREGESRYFCSIRESGLVLFED